MREKLTETLEPIEIGFGYEFITTWSSRMVITNTKEGQAFEANYVTTTGHNEELNSQTGTLYREDIQQMTGRIWDWDRIEKGIRVYMKNAGNADPEGILNLLRTYSPQQPRLLYP